MQKPHHIFQTDQPTIQPTILKYHFAFLLSISHLKEDGKVKEKKNKKPPKTHFE